MLSVVMSGCSRSAAGGTFERSDGGARGEDGHRGEQRIRRRGRPPDGSLMLGGLQQASVVGHDLVLWQVQVEL